MQVNSQQLGLFDSGAREAFWRDLRNGEHLDCPCCERYAQTYKRQIHKNLVVFLYALSREAGDENGWVEVPNLLQRFRAARDFCILKYWGFIEARPNTDERLRTSGFWRMTENGRGFLAGTLRAPKYIVVFDDRPLASSEKTISVSDVMGDDFDYGKLLGGITS